MIPQKFVAVSLIMAAACAAVLAAEPSLLGRLQSSFPLFGTEHGPVHPSLSPVQKKSALLEDDKSPPKGRGPAADSKATAAPSELQSAWGKFQLGDYEGAIEILRAQLAAHPGDELVRKNLATALFALALVKIQAQDWNESEKLLEESEKHGSKDAGRTLASLKLKMGNVDLASNLFELIADETQDPQSLRVLVDLSLRNDQLDRAADFLAKLPENDPFVKSKKEKLELRKRFSTSGQNWERGGLEVAADSQVSPAAGEVALRSMEQALNRLSQEFFGPLPSNVRMKTFLYASQSFFRTTGAPPWAGGLFDGLISIPVPVGNLSPVSLKELARTVQHEVTHAYLYGFCGDLLPSWIGEGLASTIEGRTRSDALFEIRRDYGQGEVPTDGLGESFATRPPSEVGRLYAQSLLLILNLAQEHSASGEGLAAWKSALSKVCLGRESLQEVLRGEFGFGTSPELWVARQSAILEANPRRTP